MKEFVYKKNEIDFDILMNKTMKVFFLCLKMKLYVIILILQYFNELFNK